MVVRGLHIHTSSIQSLVVLTLANPAFVLLFITQLTAHENKLKKK